MHSPSFYMCMFYFPKLFVFSQIREIEGLDDPCRAAFAEKRVSEMR